jgi:hypothetical protein
MAATLQYVRNRDRDTSIQRMEQFEWVIIH